MRYLISTKNFISILFLVLITGLASAQNTDNLWSKSSKSEKITFAKVERKSIPNDFEVYDLNLNLLKSELRDIPERKNKFKKSNTVINFPNENGKFEKYQIYEASIFEKSLQEKYPNIKSYVGKSIDNPGTTIRFSVSPLGLHAMVFKKSGGAIFIDPYTSNKESYIIYSKKSLPILPQFECKVEEDTSVTKFNPSNFIAKTENANDGNLRTFRLAIATTGEYSQFQLTNQGISVTATEAEKKAAVLSAINVTMTRVNGIFEKDLAITMELIANNTSIIFLDPLTDNLTNNDASSLIDESQSVIDTFIGTVNYDIGHTFSTGGGGLAQLNSPCTTSKARGITGSSNPIGDSYDIDFVAHEMGHQYGAHHTFNGDAGNCAGSNRNNATAVEPGSGSTIMAYAGICSPQNVQSNSDSYFHLVSIREIWTNITIGNSTCSVVTSTGNNAPTLDLLSNYTIPVSTPFVLNANGIDANNDALTYTWEQLDTEITVAPPVPSATGGPVFRSVSPSSSSMRYFPNQSTVIAGNLSNTWEVLPSVGRTMNFGVTVRDNNINGGQTASEETLITVDDTSGPFNLTSQITNEVWDAGTAQTVSWNVANTNVSPVNCLLVNILLSVDGGVTYPIVLASNVQNDGVQEVVVPNNSTTTGRVKVESVGNVFYAMNSANITIQASEFIMNFASNKKSVCSPSDVVYTFTYNTFLAFNEATTFSAINNPAGTTVVFNPVSASADNTVVEMTISNITDSNIGNHTISVTGTSASTAKTTVVELDVYSPTINAPSLVAPANNVVSVLKPYVLNWSSDVNALNYNVQISTDNTFSNIIESATVSANSYSPLLLQLNTNYFWRVKAINDCSESNFSTVFNFTTANEVCASNASTDTPLAIPDNNATGISSTINITNNKIITDVNVTVNITHPWVGDLALTLISPNGTSVILAANIGDGGDNYVSTIFDSEAASSINTASAPFTGTFIPQGNLSNFFNEESTGNWILKVVDSGNADVGQINSWSIEICGVEIIRDSDNDGVLDNLDLCPNTPIGEVVDANGCSNGQLDDDGDGVQNSNDLCPNTPSGTLVDATGCFTLPSNNFDIQVISETCPDKNNGQLTINALATQNYTTTINGTVYNFTTSLAVIDLAPGSYSFCIGIPSESYEQCFTVDVIAGTTVSGKSSVSSNRFTVEISEGTSPYTIYVNGQERFKTSSTLFEVEVAHGDLVEVKTSVSCEGVYSKAIELLEGIVAYPNPSTGIFEVSLPVTQKEVTIELYTIHSQLISRNQYPVVYGKVTLNIANQPTGLYIAKVYLDKPVTLKIIKQ